MHTKCMILNREYLQGVLDNMIPLLQKQCKANLPAYLIMWQTELESTKNLLDL